MDQGRRTHYRDFYEPGADDGPVALVHGNCQAESLRVLLAGSPTFPYPLVRVPPVHELTADDLEPLSRLLPRTRLLLSQPVRDGYRDLQLGTSQLVPGGRVLRWPVIRYSVLHPYSAIVRHPSDQPGGADSPTPRPPRPRGRGRPARGPVRSVLVAVVRRHRDGLDHVGGLLQGVHRLRR